MIAVSKLTLPVARKHLAELQKREFALRHASGALEYDAETLAPPGNRIARAQTLGMLGTASLELISSAEGIRLLDYLADHMDALSQPERRSVHLLRRSGEILRHVNLEEYLSFRKLAGEASAAWSRANEAGDFAALEPWLGRLFYAARRIADQTWPDRPPYDFWLDYNEEGLTGAKCTEFFSALREGLLPLLERAQHLPELDTDILNCRVAPIYQQRIAHFNMDALGVDRGRCRLSLSDHAFTVAFSKYDVRICTRYIPESFTTSLYGVMHECGHALYELNTGDQWQYTRLGAGASTGVHESQSRFYENMIGRSRAWTELMWPVLTSNIPELAGREPREFFRAVNAVRRTPLRDEADELTYCLHIMLRFEIERAVMNGEMTVRDAPAVWNELTEKYLRCTVRSDAEGILQDPHWPAGQIGYFPTYALGTVYAAQLMERINESIDVGESMRMGDISHVNDWMRENIWRHGALYPPTELMERALGGPLDVKCYIDYLSDKLSEVYGV